MGIWGDEKDLLERIPQEKRESVSIVLSAYRSMLSPIAYVSMAITSGRRYYDVLEAKGVKSLDELAKQDPDAIYRDIIQPNIAYGVDLAKTISQKTSLPVIAPAIFEAKKQRWREEEYMFMWYRMLEEKAQEIYMMEGWQYSNGCSQEFVRAMEMKHGFVNSRNGMDFYPGYESFKKELDKQGIYPWEDGHNCEGRRRRWLRTFRNLEAKCGLKEAEARMRKIKVYDASGKELGLDTGSFMVADAVKDLKSRGFECGSLLASFQKLYSIGSYFMDFGTPYKVDPLYNYDYRRVSMLERELWNLFNFGPQKSRQVAC